MKNETELLGALLIKTTELTDRHISSFIDSADIPESEKALFEEIKTALENPSLGAEQIRTLVSKFDTDANSLSSARAVLFVLSRLGRGVDESASWLGMSAYCVYRCLPFVYAALRCRMLVKAKRFDYPRWEKKTVAVFGDAAGEITAREKEEKTCCESAVQTRIDTAFSRAVQIIEFLHEVPDLYPLFERFAASGGCLSYAPFGISRSDMRTAMKHAKDVQGGTGILRLLSDFGRLNEAVKEIL